MEKQIQMQIALFVLIAYGVEALPVSRERKRQLLDQWLEKSGNSQEITEKLLEIIITGNLKKFMENADDFQTLSTMASVYIAMSVTDDEREEVLKLAEKEASERTEDELMEEVRRILEN